MRNPVNPESLLNLRGVSIDLYQLLIKTALEIGIKKIALVGGIVRDGFLNDLHSNDVYKTFDVDVVIEGSSSQFASALLHKIEKKNIKSFTFHQTYKTVEVTFNGILLDIASAREENYASPGLNPLVHPSRIEDDLARRDFTVNAIALDIYKGELLDPFQGLKDLKNRQLAFLHSKSVADDPTRIIRGARYASRLGFSLAPEALKQVLTTLKDWPWGWHSGDNPDLAPPALGTRLRMELEILLEREPWQLALSFLQDWGALILLDQGLQSDHQWSRRLHWAKRFGIHPLTALIAGAREPLVLAKRLQLPQNQQKLILEVSKLNDLLRSKNIKDFFDWTPAHWCKFLESNEWSPPAIALTISTGNHLWRPMFRWWSKWRHIKSPISANKLIQQGWQPGPSLGKELNRLRLEKINNEQRRHA